MKIPYTIKSCFSAAVKAQSCECIKSDSRRDDLVIVNSRETDLEEPLRVGRDE